MDLLGAETFSSSSCILRQSVERTLADSMETLGVEVTHPPVRADSSVCTYVWRRMETSAPSSHIIHQRADRAVERTLTDDGELGAEVTHSQYVQIERVK